MLRSIDTVFLATDATDGWHETGVRAVPRTEQRSTLTGYHYPDCPGRGDQSQLQGPATYRRENCVDNSVCPWDYDVKTRRGIISDLTRTETKEASEDIIWFSLDIYANKPQVRSRKRGNRGKKHVSLRRGNAIASRLNNRGYWANGLLTLISRDSDIAQPAQHSCPPLVRTRTRSS